MRRIGTIVLLAAVWIELSATIVSAQMYPGRYRNHSSYDIDAYDAAVGMNALNNANNAYRDMAQNYQAWRQQPSSQQMGIPRGAMDSDAQQRSQAIFSQQQANRDWWFQTQQQQVAQRQTETAQLPYQSLAAQPPPRAMQPQDQPPQDQAALQRQYEAAQGERARARRLYETAEFAPGFESATPAVPPAATDIIKWSPVLQAPQFAVQRARIEAPYRRSSKGLSTPTAKDYQDMIAATGQMKLILKDLAGSISAQDYLNAEAFLDQLAAEAHGRLEKASPKK
jgi:hypothetical protein